MGRVMRTFSWVPRTLLGLPAALVLLIVLSASLSGCQVAGIGAPDATVTPTAPPTATPAPATPTPPPASGANVKQWSSAPPMIIDVNKTYKIGVHTNLGDF